MTGLCTSFGGLFASEDGKWALLDENGEVFVTLIPSLSLILILILTPTLTLTLTLIGGDRLNIDITEAENRRRHCPH